MAARPCILVTGSMSTFVQDCPPWGCWTLDMPGHYPVGVDQDNVQDQTPLPVDPLGVGL
jgi:hypothetical protein